MPQVLIGGPFRELKWGELTFRPIKDSPFEHELSGTDYENNLSPNGDTYATGQAKVGFAQQECAMTTQEYKDFIAKKDGVSRSGTATTQDGQVLSLNCIIDGEHQLVDGKVTVKLSGVVELQ
jgi:hypothetical protein